MKKIEIEVMEVLTGTDNFDRFKFLLTVSELDIRVEATTLRVAFMKFAGKLKFIKKDKLEKWYNAD